MSLHVEILPGLYRCPEDGRTYEVLHPRALVRDSTAGMGDVHDLKYNVVYRDPESGQVFTMPEKQFSRMGRFLRVG